MFYFFYFTNIFFIFFKIDKVDIVYVFSGDNLSVRFWEFVSGKRMVIQVERQTNFAHGVLSVDIVNIIGSDVNKHLEVIKTLFTSRAEITCRLTMYSIHYCLELFLVQ